MLRFDLQAIAVNVYDPDAFADRRRATARRPFAVANADSSAMRIDWLDDHNHSAEELRGWIVEMRVRAVIIARSIKAPPADAHGQECEDCEQSELEHEPNAQDHRQQSGRDRGCADEDQRESRSDDLGDEEQNAANQPQPGGVEGNSAHVLLSGTLDFGFAGAGGRAGNPMASLASSPIPPNVPMSCVASTGNKMVFALGERANSAIASTYFWAMK